MFGWEFPRETVRYFESVIRRGSEWSNPLHYCIPLLSNPTLASEAEMKGPVADAGFPRGFGFDIRVANTRLDVARIFGKATRQRPRRLDSHFRRSHTWGAGGDRAVALGPDGGRLGRAATHRQFRLGRYDLDFFGRPRRRGQRALAVQNGAPNARQWLVAALVAIWSLRLGVHIAVRTAAISDDPRYAAFAQEWGARAPRRMFLFLQNQALGSIPLVFAIFVAAHFPSEVMRWRRIVSPPSCCLPPLSAKRSPTASSSNSGKVPAIMARFATPDCGAGRGIRIISSNGWAGSLIPSSRSRRTIRYPWGWASLLAPAFMYWILVHVTGIPPLEAQMLRSRGERYREYQSRTSMFFPLPPRQESRGEPDFGGHRLRRAGAAARFCDPRRDPPALFAHGGAARRRRCGRRRRVRPGNGGARRRRTYGRGQCAALRGAGGFLRPRARAEPQIFLLFLSRGRPRPCRKRRKRRCARASIMQIWPTGSRSSNSAAAGVRCRCGWRGNFQIQKWSRYRTRIRSGCISRAKALRAG